MRRRPLRYILRSGERRQRPQRASGLAFRRLPVQAVLLARVTYELHSVLLLGFRHRGAGRSTRPERPPPRPQTSMIASSFRPIRRDRISSFPAAVSKNHCPPSFFFSGIGKAKLSAPTSRIWPPSDSLAPAVHRPILRRECVGDGLVLHGIARGDNLFRIRTENCQ